MKAKIVSWASAFRVIPNATVRLERSLPVGLGVINIQNQYTGTLCGKRGL